jgi:hypothetical protein
MKISDDLIETIRTTTLSDLALIDAAYPPPKRKQSVEMV